jgi:hypothetical protein
MNCHCINPIFHSPLFSWGPPFGPPLETAAVVTEPEKKPGEEEPPDKKFDKVLSVARRAITFLSALKGDIAEGLTQATANELKEKLITTYCLTALEEEEGWEVHESELKRIVLSEKGSSEDYEELPGKKPLLKRLKKLATSFVHKNNDDIPEDAEDQPETQDNVYTDDKATEIGDHGFSSIDQAVVCNTLLAEMVRALLKLARKSNKQREFAQLILDEIDARIGDIGSVKDSNGTLDTMKKIRQHMVLYSSNCKSAIRPAKNILR